MEFVLTGNAELVYHPVYLSPYLTLPNVKFTRKRERGLVWNIVEYSRCENLSLKIARLVFLRYDEGGSTCLTGGEGARHDTDD